MSVNKNRLKIEDAEGKVIDAYVEIGVYDGQQWSLNLMSFSGPSGKRTVPTNAERSKLSTRVFALARQHGVKLVKVILIEERKAYKVVPNLNLPESFVKTETIEDFDKFLSFKVQRRNIVLVFDREFDLGTLHYDVVDQGEARDFRRMRKSVLVA